PNFQTSHFIPEAAPHASRELPPSSSTDDIKRTSFSYSEVCCLHLLCPHPSAWLGRFPYSSSILRPRPSAVRGLARPPYPHHRPTPNLHLHPSKPSPLRQPSTLQAPPSRTRPPPLYPLKFPSTLSSVFSSPLVVVLFSRAWSPTLLSSAPPLH
ncbi:uncharacterized protein EI97DRAFT_494395, partial [Westerdykella ornata]